MTGGGRRYDVDFSLALRNRTGKYVIGKEILAEQADLIDRVFYWRVPLTSAPVGALARAIDLATAMEFRARKLAGRAVLPRLRSRNPMLHLDPYTVVTARLRPDDIVLIHDMGPLTHPDLFDASVSALYDQAFRQIAAAAPRLVFVSRASLDGYAARYGAMRDARIIYPPIRADLDSTIPEAVPGLDGPFLLTVGSIGRRKNQLRCIEAFACSGLAARGVRYVLCGAREPGADAVVAAAQAADGVVLLDYVSEGQLAWLYDHAVGFVLMSLLEGFGMPVAEAIAHGLVPLVSQGTVLEEVSGNGALTAPLDDVEAMAIAMARLADLTSDEAASRKLQLQEMVASFSRDRFHDQWHAMLATTDGVA